MLSGLRKAGWGEGEREEPETPLRLESDSTIIDNDN